jgi:hypothetical protein
LERIRPKVSRQALFFGRKQAYTCWQALYCGRKCAYGCWQGFYSGRWAAYGCWQGFYCGRWVANGCRLVFYCGRRVACKYFGASDRVQRFVGAAWGNAVLSRPCRPTYYAPIRVVKIGGHGLLVYRRDGSKTRLYIVVVQRNNTNIFSKNKGALNY